MVPAPETGGYVCQFRHLTRLKKELKVLFKQKPSLYLVVEQLTKLADHHASTSESESNSSNTVDAYEFGANGINGGSKFLKSMKRIHSN